MKKKSQFVNNKKINISLPLRVDFPLLFTKIKMECCLTITQTRMIHILTRIKLERQYWSHKPNYLCENNFFLSHEITQRNTEG